MSSLGSYSKTGNAISEKFTVQGDVMLFRELVEKERIVFADSFARWEDAVKKAAEPLLRDGAISELYVEAMLDSIKKHGPYIVIAPQIAMPHAGAGIGVMETSISFMKVEEPVHFSDSSEHDANLIFVLASVDNESHLGLLQTLVEAISDEEVVARLLQAKKIEDLLCIVNN